MSDQEPNRRYSPEPDDKDAFTVRTDRIYTMLARPYDAAVKLLPVWKRWLEQALPHIRGPRVLEVSFGTGWLLTRYAGDYETYGVDLNERMLQLAQRNLQRVGLTANLCRANVEKMPYPEEHFDTVVNTMSFSGYPDGDKAMAEIHRVLQTHGRVVMIDVGYPQDNNRIGNALTGLWKRTGDVIRDMPPLFERHGFDVTEQEIGGFGSVHLYLAIKQ
jgi:ubiquinone/menaquinone biosynthesis C-methylase UbiE